MKNINEILIGLDIQIPEGKKADFDKEFAENYKTIADYDKQKMKLEQAQSDLSTARTQLEGFKDVDVSDLKNQITTLTNTLATKESEHMAEPAQRVQKNRILVLRSTGDTLREQTDQIQLQMLNQHYKAFSKAAGLPLQQERAWVAGFGSKQAREVGEAFNRFEKS